MTPEDWDLWAQDPKRWNFIQSRIGDGVVSALERLRPESEDTRLTANRWDVPGFDLYIPAGSGLSGDDAASRIVQVYVVDHPLGASLAIAGAAWFDEQGPAPREPWTRWWCHTTADDEARWAVGVGDTEALPAEVERRFAQAIEATAGWTWDFDAREWHGDRLLRETPVRYSSIEPGRRID